MDVRRLNSVPDGIGERAGSEWFGTADARLEVSLEHYESKEDLRPSKLAVGRGGLHRRPLIVFANAA